MAEMVRQSQTETQTEIDRDTNRDTKTERTKCGMTWLESRQDS